MFHKIGDEISGVVNDYDLAIIAHEGEDRVPRKERTGTWVFMASDLVENLDNDVGIPHIYGVFCFVFGYPSTSPKLIL